MTVINSNRVVRGPVTAVPVVAGKGVRLTADTANNRWVVEADETVLWEGTLSPSYGPNCNVTFQVSESILNFERIEVFCNGSINYLTWHPVSGKTGVPVAYQGLNENTSNDVVIGGVIIVDNNTTLQYRCGYGSSFTTAYRGEYWGYGVPYKVVGIGRIANN